jgi:hypothetical protein
VLWLSSPRFASILRIVYLEVVHEVVGVSAAMEAMEEHRRATIGRFATITSGEAKTLAAYGVLR